ncbi:hypothetical protein CUS_8025 [Ruminococcus albus 8]|uniref:Uncharacterized protein n=1 Tax=Ruminococcus albus 8 TaxID=246199 RepID=E9SAR3_RUMAL|nr:hypothetical protein CUS_8025 [Ruminococcus albus 8]
MPAVLCFILKLLLTVLTKLCKLCILYTYSSDEINSEHSSG